MEQDTIPDGPILTAAQLAERWGVAHSTVLRMWRNGQMPKPFNSTWGKGFRWSLAVIEEFEQTGQEAS